MTKVFFIEMSYWFFWPSVLCLALTIFRFKLKPFLLHISISTLLLSNISVLLQTTSLAYLLAILQFASGFMCLWLIFKFPLKYSFVMMLASFMIAIALEWVETTILPQLFIQFITEDNMVNSFYGCLLLSIFILVVILILRSQRLGFSFFSQSNKQRFLFKGSRSLKIIMGCSLLIILLSSILNFLYPEGLLVLPLVLSVPVVFLIRIFYKWELAE